MSEEGTAVEQPSEEEIEKVGEPSQEVKDTEQPLAEKPLSEHLKANFEKPRDERGKFSRKEQKEAIKEAPQAVEAPQHWSAEDKDWFSKQPEENKKWLLAREKSMTADYTRKTQELAEPRKKYERLEKIFEPLRPQLTQMGLDEPAAVERLLQRYQETEQFINSFKQNPKQAIDWLAGQHGVSLSGYAADEEYTDPQVAELRNQNQQLMSRLQALEGNLSQIQQAPVIDTLTRFQNAKDENGNLKYPMYEQVKTLMAPLVAQGKSLEEAYHDVVWATPEGRAKMLEEERTKFLQEEQKKQKEAREKAEAAKKAAGAPFRAGTVDSRGADLSSLPMSEHLRENARKRNLV